MSRVRRRRHRQTPPAPIDDPSQAAARGAIITRWARPMPKTDRPMRCVPTQMERAGGPRVNAPGNDNKVIFDSREAAQSCADELEAAGIVPMRAYHCTRHRPGHDGHYHLTTDGFAARAEKARRMGELEAS